MKNVEDLLLSREVWEVSRFCSLEDVKRLLKRLGNPQDQAKAVHVAGTNGKGSVCAMTASVLEQAGFRVGLFAKPHLARVTERCLINGEEISFEEYLAVAKDVVAAAEAEDIEVSFFVLTAVSSILYFARQQVDWMVIETGMGGRLDATNSFKRPEVTVVTSIGFDHVHVLGDTIEEIAREKALIAKEGVPMFLGEVSAEACGEIERVAEEIDFSLEVYGRDFVLDRELLVPLPGEHQLKNATLVARICQSLGVSRADIISGIAKVSWAGRLEKFSVLNEGGEEVDVLLDVAHNPSGIDTLCNYLESELESYRGFTFVISVLRRKEWQDMLRQLAEFEQRIAPSCRWIFTDSGVEAALDPLELQRNFNKGELVYNKTEAVNAALNGGESTLTVVTGSIFLIGSVRNSLIEQKVASVAP